MTKLEPNISRLPGVDALADIRKLKQSPEVNKSQEIEKSKSFSEFLTEKSDGKLNFSNHAKKRLESRGIDLSSDDMLKMQDALSKAQSKGAKESLILSDKGAFVVSVKNGTVITAVDKGSMKENIFTNIDSTIMI